MAEVREFQREAFYLGPGGWPGTAGGALSMGQLIPSSPIGGTILRSISFPSVHVSVGAPAVGTPPEGWWMEADFQWFIWYSDTATTSPPAFGHDPSTLFCGTLTPTLVPSPSLPTAYYVTWRGPSTGFQSHGQRKAPAGQPVYMNSGMRWEDPLSGLDSGLFSNFSVTVRTTDVCVFGMEV